jgi:hypothetical protein
VAQHDLICTILCLAAINDWDLKKINFNGPHLHIDLKEEVYRPNWRGSMTEQAELADSRRPYMVSSS